MLFRGPIVRFRFSARPDIVFMHHVKLGEEDIADRWWTKVIDFGHGQYEACFVSQIPGRFEFELCMCR